MRDGITKKNKAKARTKFVVLCIDVNQSHWLNGRSKDFNTLLEISMSMSISVSLSKSMVVGWCLSLIELNRSFAFVINCSPFRLEWQLFSTIERWGVNSKHGSNESKCACEQPKATGHWPLTREEDTHILLTVIIAARNHFKTELFSVNRKIKSILLHHHIVSCRLLFVRV